MKSPKRSLRKELGFARYPWHKADEVFMGICEVCGDYDYVAEAETGQTVCEWCQKNKDIGAWKNKRLVRAIKREAKNDGSA